MTDPTDRPTHPEPDGPERDAMLRKQAWPRLLDPSPADIIAHLLASPDDAWEVLEALAPKVAGPWTTGEGSDYHYRYQPRTTQKPEPFRNPRATIVRRLRSNGPESTMEEYWHVDVHPKCLGNFGSLEMAQGVADAELRAAGYVLADATPPPPGGSDEQD